MSEELQAQLEALTDGGQDTTVEAGANFTDFDEADAARQQFVDSRMEGIKKTEKKAEKQLEASEKADAELDKEVEEPNAKDKEVEASTGIDPEKVEVKMIKGLVGDQETQLQADTAIAVKVDGKEEQVTVQDLINNYSGKTAWDKRFTEIDRERKENARVAAENAKYKEQLAEFIRLANEDQQAAVDYVLDLSGANPHNFYKGLRDKFIGDADEWASMTPEERKLYELEKENQFLKTRGENAQKRRDQEARREKLNQEIATQVEANALTREDFDSAYNRLLEEDKKRGVTDRSYTVNEVVTGALDIKAMSLSDQIFDVFDQNELAQDGSLKDVYMTVFNFVRENAVGPESAYGAEEVVEVGRKLAQEVLGQKVEEVKQVKQPPKPEVQVNNENKDDSDSGALFDDYDEVGHTDRDVL